MTLSNFGVSSLFEQIDLNGKQTQSLFYITRRLCSTSQVAEVLFHSSVLHQAFRNEDFKTQNILILHIYVRLSSHCSLNCCIFRPLTEDTNTVQHFSTRGPAV